MIHAVTVSTIHEDARRAGKDAADELLDELGGAPDVVLLFVAASYAYEEVLAALSSRLPARVAIAGCSTAGEINSTEALSGSVTAMGLRLGGLGFETFAMAPSDDPARVVGRKLGERMKREPPALVLVFPDGRSAARPDEIVAGLHEVLAEVPIIGGGGADDGTFDRVALFHQSGHQREVMSGGVVALALRGSLRLATAAKTGWLPMGPPHTCTRVEQGTLLRELDGRPALEAYREILGLPVWDGSLATFEIPLGIVRDRLSSPDIYDEEPLLRTVMTVDESKQALVLAGAIEEGTHVRVMRATKEAVLTAASAAGEVAMSALSEPSVAFFFNCITRKMLLGARYKEELSSIISRLGPHVPKVGFYCYGEISPLGATPSYLQETFTLALVQG